MTSDDLVREAGDPTTTAARLQEIAQADRAAWAAIAGNPNAYPGLLDWLGEHGDDTVRGAIAARAVTPPAPPAPPAPPVLPAPPAAPVAETPTATVETPAEDVSATQRIEPLSPEQPAAAGTPEPTVVDPLSATITQGLDSPNAEPTPAPVFDTATETAAVAPKQSSGATSNNIGRLLVVLAVVAVLAVGGWFGVNALTGDDEKDEPGISDLAQDDEGSDDEPADEPTTSDDPDDDSAGGSGDDAAFCATMKEAQDLSTDIGTDMSDLDGLRDSYAEIVDLYNDVADNAPSEIKADAIAMADYFQNLSDVMEDPSSAGDDFSEGMSEFVDASQNVARYYYTNCS